MILKCTCEHGFQDERYGRGNRVHNWATRAGSNKSGAWRCTVCLKEKSKEEHAERIGGPGNE